MQETHYPDGRVTKEVIYGKNDDDLKQKLAKAHSYALANGATTVLQRKLSRNERCPCGSGRKFKNCCLKKQFKRTLAAAIDEKIDRLLHDAERALSGSDFARKVGDIGEANALQDKHDLLVADAQESDPGHKAPAWAEHAKWLKAK